MSAASARIWVPVAVACRVLGVSTQGYYKWLKDPVSQRDWDDAHVISALHEIHQDDPTLGYRFLTDELADLGISASENRVWRLASIAGIFASHHRRKGKAGKPGPPVHDDLLAVVDEKGRVTHEFTATAPNQVWLTDIHALEVKITHDMSRSNRNVHVTCPAQVSIHAGEVFKCSFRETGGSGVIEVKILDTSGRTHWAVVTHG